MKTIGVRELKAKLSAVLRDVRAGETILVTDRGRVVAELRAPGVELPESHVDRAMQRLSTSGLLRIAERPPVPYDASPIKAKSGTAQKMLDEERDDQ